MLVFSNNEVEHTTFANTFTLFGYFHILTYQVLKLKQNTKMLGL